jgi:DNA-binding transcriptional LysR family regulator
MHPANLDLDLLRTFVAAADTGSFTAAGDLVARSQSAVSIQIKRLEQMLSARVFERTSRSLALTRAGETLLACARRMLELNDESVRALTAPPLAGEMRIGISEYFQPQQIAGMLARFARRHPLARLDVRIGLSAGLKRNLADGELDLVIGRVEPGERVAAFSREPLYWVALRGTVFTAGQPVPLVVLPPGCVLREQALAALNRKKRPWRIALTTSGIGGVQAGLVAGLGASILPASMLQPAMRVLTPEEGFTDPGEQQLAFFERRGAPRELARAFREVVQERLDVLGVARKVAA